MSPSGTRPAFPFRAGAGNDRTLVGASMPRQSRLSVRIVLSSVSTMLISPPLVRVAPAAAASALRTVRSAALCRFQRADVTWISIAGDARVLVLGDLIPS